MDKKKPNKNQPFLLFILIFFVKSKLNVFHAQIFLHCLIFNAEYIC